MYPCIEANRRACEVSEPSTRVICACHRDRPEARQWERRPKQVLVGDRHTHRCGHFHLNALPTYIHVHDTGIVQIQNVCNIHTVHSTLYYEYIVKLEYIYSFIHTCNTLTDPQPFKYTYIYPQPFKYTYIHIIIICHAMCSPWAVSRLHDEDYLLTSLQTIAEQLSATSSHPNPFAHRVLVHVVNMQAFKHMDAPHGAAPRSFIHYILTYIHAHLSIY